MVTTKYQIAADIARADKLTAYLGDAPPLDSSEAWFRKNGHLIPRPPEVATLQERIDERRRRFKAAM